MFGKFRKFAQEFRRKGEMIMAPDQTTPNPSYSGGEINRRSPPTQEGKKIPEVREVATRCRSLQKEKSMFN